MRHEYFSVQEETSLSSAAECIESRSYDLIAACGQTFHTVLYCNLPNAINISHNTLYQISVQIYRIRASAA